MVNFLESIASKDAYFGLLGTIVGAILGFYLTRIAEKSISKNHILHLGWKVRYDLSLTRRELNRCRNAEGRSSYKEHVKSLLDSLIRLDEHFSLAGTRIGRKQLKIFIQRIFSHLNAIVDGYDFTSRDEDLFANLEKFLNRFCIDRKNFIFTSLGLPRDIMFLHEMKKNF